jgi:hypothetical protein
LLGCVLVLVSQWRGWVWVGIQSDSAAPRTDLP